jgi:hypothetical protein
MWNRDYNFKSEEKTTTKNSDRNWILRGFHETNKRNWLFKTTRITINMDERDNTCIHVGQQKYKFLLSCSICSRCIQFDLKL